MIKQLLFKLITRNRIVLMFFMYFAKIVFVVIPKQIIDEYIPF